MQLAQIFTRLGQEVRVTQRIDYFPEQPPENWYDFKIAYPVIQNGEKTKFMQLIGVSTHLLEDTDALNAAMGMQLHDAKREITASGGHLLERF